METIPFNRPFMTGKELQYISEAHLQGHLAGDGLFSRKCEAFMEQQFGVARSLLTHSCTAALEMSAILVDIGPGDEVILPSYTFVSTANAFAKLGATPVFVDIRPDTLNLNEELVEAAITPQTKCIVPVHYAGVSCEMDEIMQVGSEHGIAVIEDAAQGFGSTYRGKPLGSLGNLGTLSFHETKNIISGEGGALLVRDPELALRAEIVREKGTNRRAFFRGQVDKYTWVDVGSSYLPSDLIAAYLWAQLEESDEITRRRKAIWDRYHEAFATAEERELCRRPIIPDHCSHNAHMYYLLLPDRARRDRFIDLMRGEEDILTVFHYIPLHSAPKGQEVGRVSGEIDTTEELAGRLVRLPMWLGLEPHQDRVIESSLRVLEKIT